ncbi:MAG TPA: glycosyltransferase family 4 protein [Candidatus Binataceae bacterium]|nr:glycosyltransferase family 4 protein [Candidatus Binataceae bacterium]
MKILWICGSSIVGGAERVCIQILELLSKSSHSIAALLRRESPVVEEIQNFAHPIYHASLKGSLDIGSFVAITRSVRAFRPDVILVTTPDEWVWAALVPRGIIKVPLVFTRQMTLRLSAGVRWLADQRATAVIAGSEAIRMALLGRAGVRAQLIHVVHNPVRLRVCDKVPDAEERIVNREALGLGRDGRWIGFFGGNDPQKGIGDLLDAARRVRSTGTDLRLLICGRIDLRKSKTVPDWLLEFGLSELAHYHPNVPDVAAAMRSVEAVIVATRSSLGEGLPLTALEALACGTPVIGYATPGLVEALGDVGIVAKPDDSADLARAIAALLSDARQASEIGAAGLIRARDNFDPMRAALEYERILAAAVESASH